MKSSLIRGQLRRKLWREPMRALGWGCGAAPPVPPAAQLAVPTSKVALLAPPKPAQVTQGAHTLSLPTTRT